MVYDPRTTTTTTTTTNNNNNNNNNNIFLSKLHFFSGKKIAILGLFICLPTSSNDSLYEVWLS
jgi:hypothetical protein